MSDQDKAKVVERLRKQLGAGVVVCIAGGLSFFGGDSEDLVKALARDLHAALGSRVVFVTGGMTGVQDVFVRHCGEGARIWNMLPHGEASNYGIGTDINVGANLDERKEIFALVGDLYICVEGGQGVAMEARVAFARGASVLPLIRSGGASGGMYEFPPEALRRPSCATEEQWTLLGNADATIAESAGAAADVAGSFVRQIETVQAVADVRKALNGKICICILGGTEFKNDDSKELVQLIAADLHKSAGMHVAFVTGGMKGIQETFAKSCGDGSRVWNLLHVGAKSGYGVGQDINKGVDLEHRKQIFGALGDIYITVEGGPGVALEAGIAASRGARVIPLMRTGGASSGMFKFPADALVKPEFVSDQDWASLNNSGAPTSQTASAVTTIVLGSIKQLQSSDKDAYLEAKLLVLDALRSLDSRGTGVVKEMQWTAFTQRACPTLTQKECKLLLDASGAVRTSGVAYQEALDWIFAI